MENKLALKEDILAAYAFRHATKEFDSSRKISSGDFTFILETGRLSPSSFGFEPWKFVVVQNPELREKLRANAWGAQKQLPTASHFVLILSRQPADFAAGSAFLSGMMHEVQQLPPEVAAGKAKAFDAFLNDDFGLSGNDRAKFEWGARQTYLALGNMMTAAAMIGIDSCPVEGFNKELIEQTLEAEGILDREHFGLACMAAFGYRKAEPRAKTRQTSEQVIQWV
ncbi:NAD(P)H nitroreductase YfkO [Paenibacillus sp. FSL R7-0273]|uniref:NAD(P)H-dependent oxidoreductase n=1 Tax=Paenibacillus sp. FSL R7-0273 TaxID=1536772 RepID=UPI0004F59E07|nr:NAD(P)H-dependent oxidoreductase [Paenibacillus sp. FSL R7-0273]AIQ46646.1 NAD(P)H nitroreductase YfkO [Paenibacillus sp. FSL R7-0273]OMF97825.1 NAD(P)H-dependent oxidoreductase [Paenibacillus sp. FSL R7-0273]